MPCKLPMIGEGGGLADLEIAYMERGEQILACDSARRMAVKTLLAERELVRRMWR